MITQRTNLGKASRAILFVLLFSLIAMVLVVGCHMHLPAEHGSADVHCALCDLACTVVALVVVLLALLSRNVFAVCRAEPSRPRSRTASRSFFIRPPPSALAL